MLLTIPQSKNNRFSSEMEDIPFHDFFFSLKENIWKNKMGIEMLIINIPAHAVHCAHG